MLGTNDDTAKLIVLARLSLYGHGASRLHDEVLAVAAEWDPDRTQLRKLSVEKTGRAMNDLEAALQDHMRRWRASPRPCRAISVATSTNCVKPWSRK